MELKEFAQAVKDLLAAQNKFSQTRSSIDRDKADKLEKKVKVSINEIIPPAVYPPQSNLF